jgi:hypothetical protein
VTWMRLNPSVQKRARVSTIGGRHSIRRRAFGSGVPRARSAVLGPVSSGRRGLKRKRAADPATPVATSDPYNPPHKTEDRRHATALLATDGPTAVNRLAAGRTVQNLTGLMEEPSAHGLIGCYQQYLVNVVITCGS